MTRYWDSSALLDVLDDPRIEKLSQERDQWTRSHSLAEMFSTLTGGRLGFRFHPGDAAAMIDEITSAMNFVELNPNEVRKALGQAEARGVRGGNIHDWLHAQAAKKAKATELLTDNTSDYENLADGFTIVAP